MAALQSLNFEQAMTLVVVVSCFTLGGIFAAGRVALGFEGGHDRH